jgi:hypothetical protein
MENDNDYSGHMPVFDRVRDRFLQRVESEIQAKYISPTSAPLNLQNPALNPFLQVFLL